MASRLNLHEELKGVLGNNNVYYDPPTKLKYPCIKYFQEKKETKNANNGKYIKYNRYAITFITEDPDSSIPDEILDHFKMIEQDRHYTADHLHHYVFTLYY